MTNTNKPMAQIVEEAVEKAGDSIYETIAYLESSRQGNEFFYRDIAREVLTQEVFEDKTVYDYFFSRMMPTDTLKIMDELLVNDGRADLIHKYVMASILGIVSDQ